MTYEREFEGKVWSVSTLFCFRRKLYCEGEELDYYADGDYYALEEEPERHYRLAGNYIQGYDLITADGGTSMVREYSVLDYVLCFLPYLILLFTDQIQIAAVLFLFASAAAGLCLLTIRQFDNLVARVACCLGISVLAYFLYYLCATLLSIILA